MSVTKIRGQLVNQAAHSNNTDLINILQINIRVEFEVKTGGQSLRLQSL
jgi:hypothetical protein